jgi:hypothetical protein
MPLAPLARRGSNGVYAACASAKRGYVIAERIFGYLAEEIIGKPIAILSRPDHQKEEETIMERTAAAGRQGAPEW